MNSYKDKVVVITGAASGIGSATAELLVSEGAALIPIDLNAAALDQAMDELRKRTARMLPIAGDVASESTAERVARAAESFGEINALINCAGIDLPVTLASTTPEQWDNIMAVNVKSVFLMCKHLTPLMRERGGSIVNVASAAGLVPIANRPAYNASKGAVIALSKSLALDLAPKIRVNCVCPGAVETPLLWSTIESTAAPDSARAMIIDRYPLRRIADAEEIARVVAFLASEEASYITGTAIAVDGGRTMH